MQSEVARVLDNLEKHRPYRAVFYAFLLAGGLVLASDPWGSLEKVNNGVRYGWGGFLVFGGILTLYGTFRDYWKIELQGDILLGSSVAGLIVVLVAGGTCTGSTVVACLLASLLTAIVSRTRGLWRLANVNQRVERRRKSR